MVLELLTPWELPVKQELSKTNHLKLKKLLTELLIALAEIDPQQGINIIEDAIGELEIYDVFPLETSSTQTTLKYWEIEDFDTYFHLQHVQTNEPEICLVKGLLSACKNFLCLNQSNLNLDINQINLQRQGFKNYVYLLGRVFQLNLESC
ncbi:hypothetical protein VB711_06750 [Cronbergia sp. UHCC 0137]|uniref:hypothetical protein n=1 Tax=Cronbergia sp. UHCC 0137 TaxID=3110239 RepID=UPI002B20D7CC|nr:hypothetical protein [Cronbergia sp. UHCC 0137]MEA5617537.1 hypothetical protein [Cronbergia sp. UHCC 0137]